LKAALQHEWFKLNFEIINRSFDEKQGDRLVFDFSLPKNLKRQSGRKRSSKLVSDYLFKRPSMRTSQKV